MTDPAGDLERALAAIDRERLAELCIGIVDIASPTGRERPLAEWIAEQFTAVGIGGNVQALDDDQANAWAAIGAPGSAADLMLYAPIDTLTTGTAAGDVPWIGRTLPDHAVARARRDGDQITGLGAQNPKGHAACVFAAVEAIHRAGIELDGRLIAAFGAGGMPTNAIADDGPAGSEPTHGRRHTGQGVGASFLLEQGVWADAAVIAKSGWAIATEEVGLAWIDVTVHGQHNYVGARHRLPHRNPIVDAGRVAAFLERWMADVYTPAHATDTLAPQGIVGAARAGWWRMAAVVPAAAQLRCDLRIVPGQSPRDAWRELDAALDELRHGDDPVDVTTELAVGIPGSATSRDHWVTKAAVAAWEQIAGEPHQFASATSGATDANILRNRGLPTVRIGLPKVHRDGDEVDFAAGMNTVDVGAMELLTRHLVTTAVDVATRPRPEPSS